MSSEMSWLDEPPRWSADGGLIRVVTGLETDFWRRTFYGYVTDNGHFYHRPVTGDFTASRSPPGSGWLTSPPSFHSRRDPLRTAHRLSAGESAHR